jgi:hypothetical protein
MAKKNTSIAVMQPYIFPYLGYYQLIIAVDDFVFYDDVNYIKQGWINRNQLLNESRPLKFTVPLEKASSFRPINETKINFNLFPKWKHNFLKTLKQTYSKAPYFEEVYTLVQEIFNIEKETDISKLAIESNQKVCMFLDIKTNFHVSSEEFSTSKKQDKEERLIYLCKELKADRYINALGGQDLYDKSDFKSAGIELFFLKPELRNYKQFDNDFVAGLSIIDVLLFNGKEITKEFLTHYKIQ